MGKRGPQPEPEALVKAKRNPSKKQLPKKKAPRKSKIPKAPTYLTAGAAREWKRLVPKLVELQLATELDVPALAAYCLNYDRFRQAELDIRRNGILVKVGKNGAKQSNPYLPVSNRALAEMQKFFAAFGLTPSARMGLGISLETRTPPKTDEKKKEKPIERVLDRMSKTGLTNPHRAEA